MEVYLSDDVGYERIKHIFYNKNVINLSTIDHNHGHFFCGGNYTFGGSEIVDREKLLRICQVKWKICDK